jgi:hypothetical protein
MRIPTLICKPVSRLLCSQRLLFLYFFSVLPTSVKSDGHDNAEKLLQLCKESLNSDGQQFHQYQQNYILPLILTH